jgi:hypothetical protein
MGKVVWSRIRKVDSDRMRVTLRVTRSVRMTIEGQIKVLRGASIPSRPALIFSRFREMRFFREFTLSEFCANFASIG